MGKHTYSGYEVMDISTPSTCGGSSMSKHTPGPWSVFSTYAETEIRGPQESGAMIARIAPWGEFADEPNPQFANARLIASAPDLLQALELILPLAEFGASEQSPPYFDDRLILNAKAAIAKATGEQP